MFCYMFHTEPLLMVIHNILLKRPLRVQIAWILAEVHDACYLSKHNRLLIEFDLRYTNPSVELLHVNRIRLIIEVVCRLYACPIFRRPVKYSVDDQVREVVLN